ncbi:4-amino-4-deoxychorismate lyase [Reichenbachiella faecimaris]|uniref:4-amino-4-deoxychorismate lyase n=1 Tax=Reichenbachiella faecimaris TaxID=692418 RepID=A0A1W2G705_REIFA|nr:aminotransferase class IV [Reichenbachiella faecimaris]SMD32222.1 4-amino-4-deoxychorismate lyase [Reichenbachiella faecimaris]
MCLFIESICCVDGELQLLDLHQARVNRTFFTNFGLLAKPFKLTKIIKQIPTNGKYKCRVVYDQNHSDFEFEPYKTPKIESLQIIDGGSIDYRFKYEDRKALDQLYKYRDGRDDIIIVKDGLVTDSYYANLAFFDGEEWWTPEKPLLEGVQRQSLLDQGLLHKAIIKTKELHKYRRVSLINAMLGLDEIEVPIQAIMY